MTHILSTRRRLSTPPELPESSRTGAPRSSTGLFWLGRASRNAAATPDGLALTRARTETAVDALLATLPQHWAAFTSTALGGGDGASTVRLLVGPGGIFALHAQLYDGEIVWVHRHTVLVAGQRSPDFAVAEAGAHRLTLLLRGRLPLRTAVQPALVLLGTRALWVTGRSASSRTPPVLGAATLGAWLAARPQVLRPIERMELAAVIDNPLTWGIRPSIAPWPGSVGV